ncbi:MAG: quinolinate synthase NadA [Pseudomonadota bacterium]|nr:quinolinate synthase NadA [Pseudomonadota bacterium]
MEKIESQIQDLKKKHNAIVLAHYYEEGDIQDIADFVGDSLQIAQFGQKSDAKTIVMCGVVFMAESIKILSPEKKVLVPDVNAGCSLVAASPFKDYLHWRKSHPHHVAITYINSSVEVKSISDVICTSSNAEKIINSIPRERGILFGPDRHLGNYLSKKLKRPMELWPGACEVHVLFSAKELFLLREKHPDAWILAHPECDDSVLAQSDVVGSTSKLLSEVQNNTAKRKFIVATELGIFHQMQKLRPEAELIQAPTAEGCGCNKCPYMKLNTLEKIRDTLVNLSPEIRVSKDVLERARIPLERMMEISSSPETCSVAASYDDSQSDTPTRA